MSLRRMSRDLKSRQFCIYGLADLFPFAIRYVGRTCSPLQARVRCHRGIGSGARVREWIRTVPAPGPAIVVLGYAWGVDAANRAEREAIARMLALGGDLLNVRDRPKGL